MSGHSKWSTIKRKKEKTDAQRAKIFTKIGRELAIAVRSGGPDPAANNKLRDCIAKAKSNNVPSDNIDRIIKKAAGEGDGASYEEITYEGYGPSGVAVIVATLTDNRNRTAGDLRHYFDKFGGNMGQPGSVSFMFNRKGVILVNVSAGAEDTVMEAALEAGAEDFTLLDEDGVYEIVTEVSGFAAVREALEQAYGDKVESAELSYIPTTYSSLTDEDDITKMTRLLDTLDDNDDVQDVWHNLQD